MAGYFKSYDIRGKYKIDFDEEEAYKIGFFLPKLLKTDKILVGRDGRLSSPALYEALVCGITDSGADVLNIGVSTTPMVYYFTEKLGVGGSVQITASHNSKEYNGFKISKTHARPVGYANGLNVLEEYINSEEIVVALEKGKIYNLDVKNEYIEFMKSKLGDISEKKVVIDCSNGATCTVAPEIFGSNVIYLNSHLDGNFPAHEPNPLEEENTNQLKKAVIENGADIGIIFDGDGDRVVFVNEKGEFISPDLITAVLAEECAKKGDTVIYDIRTSKSVDEYIKKLGADTYMWKVGHVNAKAKLREIDAVLGGELAGHYYFKEFTNCDSGILAAIKVLGFVKKLQTPFSQKISEISKYAYSGEINFRIKDKEGAINALLRWAENPEKVYDFDGYRIEFPDRWFNIRVSNTEDYLRLVAEANTEDILNKMLSEITDILEKFR